MHIPEKLFAPSLATAMKTVKGGGGNLFLREYIDLYFNSKYARKGYFFNDEESGKDVPASLTDATQDGKDANITTVWNFIEYIDRDRTGTPALINKTIILQYIFYITI